MPMQIFFESNVTLQDCYIQIRRRQGFGDLLSEYKKLSKLGKGAYGYVVLAQHKNSKSRVAINIMSKKRIEFEYDNLTEPFQEITLLQAIARAKFPQVLELIDYYDDHNLHYLVTKVYDGGNLYSYFKERI